MLTAVCTLLAKLHSITGNVAWDSNQTLTTDMVIQNGASLTTNSEVTVTANGTDPFPYPNGLSPKIEIIVENGSTLVANEATLAANGIREW